MRVCPCRPLALTPARADEIPQTILQDLRSFRQMGSVLYVAAHPDDENTQLIAYLARGRDYRTAYLSLTRGDGGQNVIGPEFGDALGRSARRSSSRRGGSTAAASSSRARGTSDTRRTTARP